MKELEDQILKSGTVIDNKILKVDNFFNYKISNNTLKEAANYITNHFKNVDKILTFKNNKPFS